MPSNGGFVKGIGLERSSLVLLLLGQGHGGESPGTLPAERLLLQLERYQSFNQSASDPLSASGSAHAVVPAAANSRLKALKTFQT